MCIPKINEMLPNFRQRMSDCPLNNRQCVLFYLWNQGTTCTKRNQKLEQIY